jgi:protein ImuB
MSDRLRQGSGRSSRLRHDTGESHRLHESGESGLYACLYQPPLPGQVVVEQVEFESADIRTPRPDGSEEPSLRPTTNAQRLTTNAQRLTTNAQRLTTNDQRPTSPLLAIAAEFSPRYEQHRADLVSLDLRGLSRLFGSPRAIGEELRREAATRGLRVHVALAVTRMAALVLASARPGLTVVAAAEQPAALASIPLGVLERLHEDVQPGSGSATQVRVRADEARAAIAALKRWGVRTLGELAALPAADLSARLGRGGRVWQAIARGDEVRPLVPLVPEERFEGSTELEWPIDGHEPLSFVLTRLLEPLSTRLERRDRGAAVLHVTLRLVTRDTHTCRLDLPSPLRDVRALRTLALLDLEAHPPVAAIDHVTVTIEPTPGRIVQHALFARPHPTPEQLSTLLARLGALMGQDRIGAPALIDSYRPGAWAMTPFSTEHEDISPNDQPPASDLRPPDDLPAPSALRRCRQPVPARVVVDARQRPQRITTERRGFAGGSVLACAGPWRTSGAWWDDEYGCSTKEQVATDRSRRCDSGPWSHDEWDVSLDDGAIYRIFRDRTTDAWFIEAVID